MPSAATVAAGQLRSRPELDGATVLFYGAFSCLGFLLNGLGPALPFLQRELAVDRSGVAWYPLLFAAGLVLVGLAGERVVAVVGRTVTFWTAVASLGSGAVVLASAVSPVVSGVGAGVMGTGGALLVLLLPAVFSDLHGSLSAGAIAEANAIASSSAVLAPLLIAGAVALGAGWRPGLLALPLAVLAVLAVRGRRVRLPGGAGATLAYSLPAEGGRFFRRWLDILLVVSIEFCFVFWSTDFLATEIGIGPAAAAALAAFFLGGMALGRAVGGRAAGRLARPRPVFLAALGVATLGFVVFWSTGMAAVAAAGLLVAGLGVALLYPLSVARALAAMPSDLDRASARAALASGLAIGVAPFALAMVSEGVGLRAAFLVVPALAAAAFANALIRDA